MFGTEENYVIPVQSLAEKDTLAKAFEWLLHNEQNIKKTLVEVLPEYKSRINIALSELSKL